MNRIFRDFEKQILLGWLNLSKKMESNEKEKNMDED